jgi:hypothetical protein
MRKLFLLIVVWVIISSAKSQQLQPGFNKEEFEALLRVSAQFGDSSYAAQMPVPAGYVRLYHSPIVGLDNCWELWKTTTGIPVINIRGTTKKQISWLANFYAAMIPAKGQLQLSKTERFDYDLAEDPKAAVHTGWMIATAFLSKDMLPKIDSFYKKGNHEFYIVGFSQGGAISYLLAAYLYGLQRTGKLPQDLRFKTFCGAAPKPGNLYFANEYEALTQNGWAYNVVNAADWVPQTPFSVQTLSDLATVNPFTNATVFIDKQKWPKRWLFRVAYGKLTKPANKVKKRYQKYLGNYISKSIKKALPGFQSPAYVNSSDYVRTGTIITLLPKEDYYQIFPQDPDKLFLNHSHMAYLYLLKQLR